MIDRPSVECTVGSGPAATKRGGPTEVHAFEIAACVDNVGGGRIAARGALGHWALGRRKGHRLSTARAKCFILLRSWSVQQTRRGSVQISQRHERGATLITSNLPFDEWTETFGTGRLTGTRLDRLTHHVNILEMNGESYRLGQSRPRKAVSVRPDRSAAG